MKKKKIIVTLILIISLITYLFLITKREKFLEQNTENISSESIVYYIKNDNNEYDIHTEYPDRNKYVLNKELSKCNNGALPTMSEGNVSVNIKNASIKNDLPTKCHLYFDKETTIGRILENSMIGTKTPYFSLTSCNPGTNTYNIHWHPGSCDQDAVGLYCWDVSDNAACDSSSEAGNKTYFFRGDIEYNYLKFADVLWRIIRINENGSIRIILNEYNYNLNSSNRTYDFINNKGLANYLDKESGFCIDDAETNTSGEVNGITRYYYSPFTRLGQLYNKPVFTCKDGTFKNVEVGEITADEVVFAGGIADSRYHNTGYYLVWNYDYYTASPSYYTKNSSGGIDTTYKFAVTRKGYVASSSNSNFRAVINLSPKVKLSGYGTYENPYVVVGLN